MLIQHLRVADVRYFHAEWKISWELPSYRNKEAVYWYELKVSDKHGARTGWLITTLQPWIWHRLPVLGFKYIPSYLVTKPFPLYRWKNLEKEKALLQNFFLQPHTHEDSLFQTRYVTKWNALQGAIQSLRQNYINVFHFTTRDLQSLNQFTGFSLRNDTWIT